MWRYPVRKQQYRGRGKPNQSTCPLRQSDYHNTTTMGAIKSASLDVGYPIYAAKFINNKTVLVAGGGGEGNNGIPNKITAIKCFFKAPDKSKVLQKFREITLPKNEDSPMCLDVAAAANRDDGLHLVFVGCNQSTELINSMSINNNLRKYVFSQDEHLRFLDAAQLDVELGGLDSPRAGGSGSVVAAAADEGQYPKAVYLSTNNTTGCFMTSKVPSSIYIFDPETLETRFKFTPAGDAGEIKDFHLSPDDDGKTICYVTTTAIATASTITGNPISSSVSNQKVLSVLADYVLSKVKFIDNSHVIITAIAKPKSKVAAGLTVFLYRLSDHALVRHKHISKKIKGVTAIDATGTQNLIALAANDTSLTLIRLSDFKTVKVFKKLHSFAITRLTFSPNGRSLASVSAANSLHVMKLPPKFANQRSTVGTLVNYLLAIIFTALISIILQKAHENGQLEVALQKLQQYSMKSINWAHEHIQGGFGFIKSKFDDDDADSSGSDGYFKVDNWNNDLDPRDYTVRDDHITWTEDSDSLSASLKSALSTPKDFPVHSTAIDIPVVNTHETLLAPEPLLDVTSVETYLTISVKQEPVDVSTLEMITIKPTLVELVEPTNSPEATPAEPALSLFISVSKPHSELVAGAAPESFIEEIPKSTVERAFETNSEAKLGQTNETSLTEPVFESTVEPRRSLDSDSAKLSSSSAKSVSIETPVDLRAPATSHHSANGVPSFRLEISKTLASSKLVPTVAEPLVVRPQDSHSTEILGALEDDATDDADECDQIDDAEVSYEELEVVEVDNEDDSIAKNSVDEDTEVYDGEEELLIEVEELEEEDEFFVPLAELSFTVTHEPVELPTLQSTADINSTLPAFDQATSVPVMALADEQPDPEVDHTMPLTIDDMCDSAEELASPHAEDALLQSSSDVAKAEPIAAAHDKALTQSTFKHLANHVEPSTEQLQSVTETVISRAKNIIEPMSQAVEYLETPAGDSTGVSTHTPIEATSSIVQSIVDDAVDTVTSVIETTNLTTKDRPSAPQKSAAETKAVHIPSGVESVFPSAVPRADEMAEPVLEEVAGAVAPVREHFEPVMQSILEFAADLAVSNTAAREDTLEPQAVTETSAEDAVNPILRSATHVGVKEESAMPSKSRVTRTRTVTRRIKRTQRTQNAIPHDEL